VESAHGPRNLVGASRAELTAVLAELNAPAYRISQVHHWLNRRLADSLEVMTDLPKGLRGALAERCIVADPDILEVRRSPDGTTKFAFACHDGAVIEAVSMPMAGRTTLCLSSQAGCVVGCVFCVTGVLGPGRNLTAGEIFGQYRAMVRSEKLLGQPLNVVFMGMGEPLLNLTAVGRATELLGETVSLRRITVSTSGIAEGLRRLAALPRRPNLAVSLNATTQEQRARLMPVAARWALDDLLAALRAFPLERGRRITIEYVLLAGLNDGEDDARRLPKLLGGIPVKVNLIPFNADTVLLPDFHAPTEETVNAFAAKLADAHLNVTVRWSRGQDVSAACGQLRGRMLAHRRRPGHRPASDT
jgi:23S rRNA (adenine2503-C2)-methyltransferase